MLHAGGGAAALKSRLQPLEILVWQWRVFEPRFQRLDDRNDMAAFGPGVLGVDGVILTTVSGERKETSLATSV
jgi:hypothetical protein